MKQPTYFCCALFLLVVSPLQARERGEDAGRIVITKPNPASQVMSPDYAEKIGRSEAQLLAISQRLDSIDASIKDMKGDMKDLTETNHVMNFIVGSLKIFVPIMFATWFGLWLVDKHKHREHHA